MGAGGRMSVPQQAFPYVYFYRLVACVKKHWTLMYKDVHVPMYE
jgi:hypothetical protein